MIPPVSGTPLPGGGTRRIGLAAWARRLPAAAGVSVPRPARAGQEPALGREEGDNFADGGFPGAGLLNVLVGVNLAAAASAHMTQQAAAVFLVTSFRSVPAQVATDVYFLGEVAAPVIMGVALWRSRSVPRWLAVLFVLGLGIAEGLPSWGPIALLPALPLAVAMVLLAARIWQAAALPASHDQELAAVSAAT